MFYEMTNRPGRRIGRRAVQFTAAIAAGFLATFAVGPAFAPAVHAKSPGATYCFVGKCHRVKTLSETRSLVGKTIPLNASHYEHCSKDRYNPCGLTSSGERFHPDRPDNAASPIYPDGTVLLVRNPATRATAVLRINNAGPYWGNRKLDVSHAAAKRLGFAKRGVASLETRILSAPNKRESKYRKHRAYRMLPGFIGEFDDLDEAERVAVAIMMLDASAGSALAPTSGAAIALAVRKVPGAERKLDKRRKDLAPIVKTMRMIAELKPSEAAPVRTASVPRDLTARRTVALADAAGVTAAATSGEGRSPARRLAVAALDEIGAEMDGFAREAAGAAAELVRTAEVGRMPEDAWDDLLRPRLGLESLVRARGNLGFGLPDLPQDPGRRPRRHEPLSPNLVRYGMTG